MITLAGAYAELGALDQAADLGQQALNLLDSIPNHAPQKTVEALLVMSRIEGERSRSVDQERYARRAEALSQSSLRLRQLYWPTAIGQLCSARYDTGQPLPLVESEVQAALDSLRSISPDHEGLVLLQQVLGAVQMSAGRPADALATLEGALALAERHFVPEHPRTTQVSALYGEALVRMGEATRAERLLRARADDRVEHQPYSIARLLPIRAILDMQHLDLHTPILPRNSRRLATPHLLDQHALGE